MSPSVPYYPRIGLFIDGEWIHHRDPWTQVVKPSN